MTTRILLLCAALCLTVVCNAADFPNLVKNPGFETKATNGLPEGWDGPTNVFSQVASPVHSGQAALQFVNPDPGRYALSHQPLPLQAGKMYEFSVWVKCEDVQGLDSGATICLEFWGKDGKYLGGQYPGGIKGTTGWTQIKGSTGRIPADASCNVTCYVRQRMTGKAWWDDVEVKQWLEPPLYTMLQRPNYRGLLTPTQNLIHLTAELKLDDYDLKPADVELRCGLARAGTGTPVPPASWVVQPTGMTAELKQALNNFPPGDYLLNIRLVRKSDRKTIGRHQWRLALRPEGDLQKRTAYIDAHNRLIVDGQPFLPLGMYFGSLDEATLKQYADSAFNCVMPYGGATAEEMDRLQRHDLKIIYTLKDAYYGSGYCPKEINSEADERPYMAAQVKQFGTHPALLAWYLNDELSPDYMPRLEAHQQWLEELDPNHPTWIVLYQVGQLDMYRKTYDVLGTDPYPIPSAPARQAANYTKTAMRSMMGSRPLWQVPQVMNWACYRKTEEEKKECRPPTYDEMRSMTWQCLTEGATGLVYYSWFDLKKEADVFDARWEECKRMAAEVKRWSPVILSIEPAPQVTTAKQDWLHWTVRRVGRQAYLFAVNDEEKPHEATFALPRKSAALKCGNQTVPAPGGKWTAQFQPFGLKVYEIGL